jgi:hypothetical protein
MSQNDMSIADQAGASFLADVNSAVQALASRNSGASAPSTTYAYEEWADTTSGFLKFRNGANSAWLFGAPLATPMAHMGTGIHGNTLSNNGSDAVNDIDVTAGGCADTTNAYWMVGGAITKRLDASWAVGTNQGGLDTGAVANGTYHVWRIARSDTGVVDVLFSLSASAPTMPTNYDYKRRIGSIVRAGATILAFTQDGDYFRLSTAVKDVETTNPGASAVTATLASCPTGINIQALFNVVIAVPSTSARGYFSDLASTDAAPSQTAAPGYNVLALTSMGEGGAQLQIRTNTSAQIRYRLSASDASTVIRLFTLGWIDGRGK